MRGTKMLGFGGPSKVVTDLIQRAKTDPEAMNLLAERYFKGDGVPKDIKKAIPLFEAAVDANNTQAMMNLGFLCKKAIGMNRDTVRAKDLFEKAAALGETEAYGALAETYLFGMGRVKQDLNLGLKNVEKLIDIGQVDEVAAMLGLPVDMLKQLCALNVATNGNHPVLQQVAQRLAAAQPSEYMDE